MPKSTVESALVSRGFHKENTGGNCTAYVFDGNLGMRFLLVNGMAFPTSMNDPVEFWSEESNGNTYKVSDAPTLAEWLKEFDIANS